MSRKTKAELEAENRELKDTIGRLADEIENLRDFIKLLHDLSDEDRRDLKIETEAHNGDIKRLAKLSKPRIQREWAALERKKYLQSQFAGYRRQELNITISRDNANNDMAKKFGEKHRLKQRRLITICKD